VVQMWSMAGFLWHQSFKLPQTDDISGQGPSISPVLDSGLNAAGCKMSIALAKVFLMENADEFWDMRTKLRARHIKMNRTILQMQCLTTK